MRCARLARGGLGLAALVALAATTTDARAAGNDPLRRLGERVVEEWRKAGARVDRGPPRFLYDDETMTVTIPRGGGEPCTTVALLGSRGLSFHAKIAGADDDPLNDESVAARAASVAGVLEITSCEPTPLPMDRLLVTSDAGRGAIETIVARSPKPPPGLRQVLPERTGGVLPPPPDAGPPPKLPLPARRAETAELRAKRDAGKIEERLTWSASADGAGDARVPLAPGCHLVEVFARDDRVAPRRRRLDVDAEIRDEDDELLARDRTDAADAHLEACVGEPTKATVIFAGAPARSEVIATHAFWPMPPHLPAIWGPAARARMARALLARHADAPPDEAVALFAGPAGTTPVPIAIEPGACYVAIAAVTHGHARGLGLRALIDARDHRDERTADDDAGVVAFCARDASRARLEVEARGVSLAWGLALFRVSGREGRGR